MNDAALSPRRLSGLDGIRGILALCVALAHALGHFLGWAWEASLLPGVGFAVDVFFVMSAVVLYYVHAHEICTGALSPGAFILKRILRLFPLHLATMGIIPLALLMGTGVAFPDWAGGLSPHGICGDLFQLQTLGIGFPPANNPPTWSISVEFWVGTPLVIAAAFAPKITLLFLLLAMALFFGFQINTDEADAVHAVLVNGGITRGLFCFSAGILGYIAIVRSKLVLTLSSPYLLGIGLLGLAAIGMSFFFPPLTRGFYMLLVAGVSLTVPIIGLSALPALGFLDRGILGRLGKYSFSIYLSHTPIIYSLLSIRTGDKKQDAIMAIFAVVLTVVLSKYIYTYIERPFIIYSKRF